MNRIYAGGAGTKGCYTPRPLLGDAERELKALVVANPQSPIAKSLLRDLRSKKRRP